MDPKPAFTFHDLFTFVIGDMAKALAERDGENPERQFARSQAAAHLILGFSPRDGIEAMLAGHCVMLHEVMTADVRSTLRCDVDPKRRGPRSNLVGLNKAFNDNLDRLERCQLRPSEGSRDAPEATPGPDEAGPPPDDATEPPQQPRTVPPALNRAARRQAARAEGRAAAAVSRAAPKPMLATVAQTSPGPASRSAALGAASPAAIAACQAKPNAMAALQSGDAAGFARAMGIDHPSEAFLAAANAKDSPFHRRSNEL
jgi:hypothetical protein